MCDQQDESAQVAEQAAEEYHHFALIKDYLNSREDWVTEDTESVLASAGDLGPEGLVFIPASDSPNDKALLVVGYEVSGTTAVYEVEALRD